MHRGQTFLLPPQFDWHLNAPSKPKSTRQQLLLWDIHRRESNCSFAPSWWSNFKWKSIISWLIPKPDGYCDSRKLDLFGNDGNYTSFHPYSRCSFSSRHSLPLFLRSCVRALPLSWELGPPTPNRRATAHRKKASKLTPLGRLLWVWLSRMSTRPARNRRENGLVL